MAERLATLISGGGTTMQEIIKACQSGEIPLQVACVISSNPNAGGIEKARNLGIPERDILVINPDDYKDQNGKVNQQAFGITLFSELDRRGVDVVTQNGWMPLTPDFVVGEFEESMFNQHPGPVPEFGGEGMFGRRVHAARLNFIQEVNRDHWTEAIAQRIHKEYDKGTVVKSEKVEIFPDDTVDSLQQRVLPVEHRVQIEMLKDFANGTLKEAEPRKSLVMPGEEEILFLARQKAIKDYPNG